MTSSARAPPTVPRPSKAYLAACKKTSGPATPEEFASELEAGQPLVRCLKACFAAHGEPVSQAELRPDQPDGSNLMAGRQEPLPDLGAPTSTAPAAGAAAALSKYIDVDALVGLLEQQDIVLVWASWLLELAGSDGRFLRRQDLPARAVVDTAALKRLATEILAWHSVVASAKPDVKTLLSHTMRFPPFVVVSYAWLSRPHPDPDGRQLQEVLAPALEWYMSERARLGVEDNCAMYAGDINIAPTGPDFAVFLDFSGLWQNERTDEQDASFRRGLASMDLLYAHQDTAVLRMTRLLDGYDALPYGGRGWPYFETTVSQLIKPAHLSLDLGTDAAKGVLAKFEGRVKPAEALAEQGSYEHEFIQGDFGHFKGARAPPLTPAEFERRVANKTVTNGKDKQTLIDLQAKVATAVLGGAHELSYLQLGWGAAEAQLLADALHLCAELRSLDLTGNPLGHDGVAALARSLEAGAAPRLATLNLHKNRLGDEGAKALAPAIAGSASLTSVDISTNSLGSQGAKALATALAASGSITAIDVGSNRFDQPSARLILEAMKGKDMQSIGMGKCNLGVEEAKILAEYASGMGSLTYLHVAINFMGDEGEAAIREAVRGKQGFVLEMW